MVAATGHALESPGGGGRGALPRAGLRAAGLTLNAYAAVQVWAQAVGGRGLAGSGPVIDAMHSRQFDTVLGRIGFDEKGDVTGFEPWQWFVWQADGTYVPLEQSLPSE